MKRFLLFLIFLIFNFKLLYPVFETSQSTTFTKSISDISAIYTTDDFINFSKNPSHLTYYNFPLYGIDYQNSFFDNMFYNIKFYYLNRFKNLGFGILFSDFISKDENLGYSEYLLNQMFSFHIKNFLSAGFNFKFYRIVSNYLDGNGFNSDIAFSTEKIYNFAFSLRFQNFINSKFIWDNNNSQVFKRLLNLTAGYNLNFSIIKLFILVEYTPSNLKLENYTISDKNDEAIKSAVIIKIHKNFYISSGISKYEKNFGAGISTRYFIFYFANSLREIGNQQSITITFKGGE